MIDSDILILHSKSYIDRIDKFIANNLDGITRSQVKKLINAGSVKVDGRIASPATSISPGQYIEVIFEDDALMRPK